MVRRPAAAILAGVMLASATVFSLLLSNFTAVMGPDAISRTTNAITAGVIAARRVAIAVALLMLLSARAVHADPAPAASSNPGPSPSPIASPAASPVPTKAAHRFAQHGFALHGSDATAFVAQGASGPGLSPVEGASFASGSVASPVTPYDMFSGAPTVPGDVAQNQFVLDAAWTAGDFSASAEIGAESLVGDRTNEAYWALPLQPEDDPHLGSTVTGFTVGFPTHPGQDDYDGTHAGLTRARVSWDRGRYAVTGGWFTLAQWLGFVFNPATTTNALPSLVVLTPESLNPNPPALDGWTFPSSLPMRGFDVRYDPDGRVPVEAADAELPSLPGTPGRVLSLSAGKFDAAGHGLMAQFIAAHTGGDPIATTTGFGADAATVATDQGIFAVSTLSAQYERIAGARLSLPAPGSFDATLEYARSSYRTDGLGSSRTAYGAWGHAALAHAVGDATAALHYFRFDPTFATMVLPYGTAENVWSVAYSWPGPWLKSTYQLVDPSTLGVNREGPMVTYARTSGGFTADASYADFHQIVPFTTASSRELALVDGFFLVQTAPALATTGWFKRTSAFVGQRFAAGDVGLDVVTDDLHRSAAPSQPLDAVSYEAGQYVLSFSRRVAHRGLDALVAADYGYYGLRGTWADGSATNVDVGMRFAQVGAQVADRAGSTMLTLRRSVTGGAPYFGALGLVRYGSPDFQTTTLLVARRYRF